MVSDDSRYVIVFNGEIYNFSDLKKELERLGRTFKSSSDTGAPTGFSQWETAFLKDWTACSPLPSGIATNARSIPTRSRGHETAILCADWTFSDLWFRNQTYIYIGDAGTEVDQDRILITLPTPTYRHQPRLLRMWQQYRLAIFCVSIWDRLKRS